MSVEGFVGGISIPGELWLFEVQLCDKQNKMYDFRNMKLNNNLSLSSI